MATKSPSRIGPPHLPELRCGEQVFAMETAQHVVTAQFAVVWLQKGEATLSYGRGRRHHLNAGEAFHRLPEQTHTVHFTAGTRTLFIALPADGLRLLRGLGVPAIADPVFRPGLHPDLARRWHLVGRDLARARPRALASLAGRLLELAADLHQRAAGGNPRLDAAMEQAARRLADPQAAALKQPALARSLGLSYRTFRRAFVAYAGQPPEAYRIRCRIAAAQELLRASDEAIAAIAERLGYRDGADLARQFARVTGRSPRAYRSDPLLG